ncbi:NAD-dependent epimerase/dehydratase family protein [Methylibium sp.]|uniref:NAD-dependent epimerase/dehydratase family protein n=1 Tax=Methylibium sp. TaxID=2067992 RepID=UPI003D13FEC8
MKILVTGAAGFLGRACTELLGGRGHGVVTTDRQGAVELKGDLRDRAFVSSLPAVDAVLHAAAVQYVSRDLPLIKRKNYFHDNNVVATARLCERYAGEPTHFVNVGTSMMYEQNRSTSYGTTSEMAGQGVYSISKLAALEHVRSLSNRSATVIPCIIGGVGREGLFRSFVSTMKNHGLVMIPGSGTHATSMVHVRDVASLIARIIEVSAVGFFNAAAPSPLSILEWVDEIEDELDLEPVRRIRLPLAPVHLVSAATGFRLLAREQLLMLSQAHVLSIDESLEIGWQPEFDNARIVRDIARYISGP